MQKAAAFTAQSHSARHLHGLDISNNAEPASGAVAMWKAFHGRLYPGSRFGKFTRSGVRSRTEAIFSLHLGVKSPRLLRVRNFRSSIGPSPDIL